MGSFAESIVRESFLSFLSEQEEHVRLDNYRYYDNYYHGFHVTSLPKEIQDAYKNPLSMIANYCKAVVDIPTRYIVGKPSMFGIDASQMGQKTPLSYAVESELYRVYRASGMLDAEMIKFVRMAIKKGDGFIKLQNVSDYYGNQDIRIRVIRPDVCYPRFRDDDYDETLYTAIKWYEQTGVNEIHWYAQVFYPPSVKENTPTQMHVYDLGTTSTLDENSVTENDDGDIIKVTHMPEPTHIGGIGSQGELVDVQDLDFPGIPVFQVRNNVDDRPWGVSDLHDVCAIQDALNKAWTDLLYIMDEQAFQRLFLFGAHGDSRIELSPGKVTNIPNESGRLDVIPPTNISQFLFTIDSLLDAISGVSGTPKQAFGEFIQGMPASGFALTVRYMPLEDKCNEKRAIFKGTLRRMNDMIIYMLAQYGRFNKVPGFSPEALSGIEVKVHFPGGLPKDEVQQAQVHSMELSMGIKSRTTIMEERGIENIPEEERRLGIDQLVYEAQEKLAQQQEQEAKAAESE